MAFLIGASVYIFTHYFKQPLSDDPLGSKVNKITAPAGSESSRSFSDRERYSKNNLQNSSAETPSRTHRPDFTRGIVTIRDISGGILSQTMVPVVSKGLVALPVHICYGGYSWSFSDEISKQHFEIEWGLLHDFDQVGLWWIEDPQWNELPKLSPWLPQRPLYWASIMSNGTPIRVTVEDYTEQGDFSKIKLQDAQTEPGVFFQEERIVGWSFGKLLDGGYLWTGIQGEQLTFDFRTEDFYGWTFAGTRGEAFVTALANEDASEAEIFFDLARGFLLDSAIPDDLLPVHLQTQPILDRLNKLAEKLLVEENYQAVADGIDSEILIRIQDQTLLRYAVYATYMTDSNEVALWLLETVRPYIPEKDNAETAKIEQMQNRIYLAWLSELQQEGELYALAEVLDRALAIFPDDSEIHLWAVRLALEQENWREAEQLLYSKEYPPAFQESVTALADQISDLKGREEKIVIRFTPGSKAVPVRANLNRTVSQDFIVDTGATTMTIPSATAAELGIEIDSSYPIRTITTVSGIIRVPEVILPSIEINGWVVRDIEALVVDLPRQDGIGLLGLNYLNLFQMNLNVEEGIMTLEPR